MSSICKLSRDSRGEPRGPLRAACAALFCACLALSGCGRVGLELWPSDAGGFEDEDADMTPEDDAGMIDAGSEMDGSAEDAASDGAVPFVDGCVLTEEGSCATCDPATYVRNSSCFTGCFDTPSFCNNGIEFPCMKGKPRAANDTTCDGVDDDCDKMIDEDYDPAESSCGVGVCASTAELMCVAGSVRDTCTPGVPRSMRDDATGSGNGVDDDCDGSVDEDVSTCTDTVPRPYEAGVYNNIVAPTGCNSVTIQLWGGAGSAGRQAGISEVRRGGRGGSGGYARSTLSVTGPITLYVGSGAAGGDCSPGGNAPGAPGTYSGGAAIYSGGRGGRGLVEDGDGVDGRDGMIQGGGKGATNLLGHRGGDGFFGGGGGGAGLSDPVNDLVAAAGGSGGAASVVLMSGTRVMVAGGGGGGGAASSLVYAFGESGGTGGEGCSGSGTSGDGLRTGGGGGGGVCQGTVVSMGTNGTPANASSVPAPRARGTNNECNAGGNGYAIVTFAR